MPKSLTSLPVAIVDVPEPSRFQARFEYNFFTRDELVNDTGEVSTNVLKRLSLQPHASFFEDVNNSRRIPRVVRFDFIPTKATAASRPGSTLPLGVLKQPKGALGRAPRSLGLAGEGISVAGNIDKVMTEEEFASFGFTGLDFQDTQIDGKLYFLASGSIAARLNGTKSPVGAKEKKLKIDPAGLSFVDAAQFLNDVTPNSVDGELGADVLNQPDAKQVSYIDEQNTKIINSSFNDLKQVRLRAQLSNRHVHKMLSYLVHETTSIYCDEIRSMLPTALESEEIARQIALPDTINVEEYDTRLQFVDLRPLVDDAMPQLTARVIGYIIDKYELRQGPEGPIVRREPIIIERQNATAAADFKVRYGSTYSYSIRAVAIVEFPATSDDENGQNFVASCLVASQPSPRRVVQCHERVPPPPPADLNVTWDFGKRKPRLTWCMPVNTQRDVKKFQVFRRRSVNEPFELVKMYDFNDAIPAMPDLETPDERLVVVSEQPVLLYIDESFKKEEKWIYAVCSLDAHGLTSAYSIQFEIGFDRFKNNITKRMISTSGAPKAYPNLNIAQDTFLDSIRDSNHTHVRVAFTPETLQLRDNKGNDLELLGTDRTGGSYRLQLINVDFQQQQDVDITVNDLRPPATGIAARVIPKTSLQFTRVKN